MWNKLKRLVNEGQQKPFTNFDKLQENMEYGVSEYNKISEEDGCMLQFKKLSRSMKERFETGKFDNVWNTTFCYSFSKWTLSQLLTRLSALHLISPILI